VIVKFLVGLPPDKTGYPGSKDIRIIVNHDVDFALFRDDPFILPLIVGHRFPI
jgi:hypothetical protein